MKWDTWDLVKLDKWMTEKFFEVDTWWPMKWTNGGLMKWKHVVT